MSEEEQMQAMLAEMGMSSIESLEESTGLSGANPIPEGPVKRNIEATASVEQLPEESAEAPIDLSGMEVTEDEINTEDETVALEETKKPSSFLSSRTSIGSSRELTVSSLVHLMGLPTGLQIGVLDTKLDLVAAKLSTVQAKLEKIQTQMELLTTESPLERIEFQLTEVRSVMKKFFPLAFQSSPVSQENEPSVHPKPQMLSSKATDVGKAARTETAVHVDVPQAEEEEPMTDEDYQVLESMKMRQETAEKLK